MRPITQRRYPHVAVCDVVEFAPSESVDQEADELLPEGWEDPKEAGRAAIKRVLEERMRQRVRSYIEEETESRGSGPV